MMFKVDLSLSKSNKLYIYILNSSVLAVMAVVLGIIPQVSMRSHNNISLPSISLARSAAAQEFTPEEAENYAKAGYEVELLRREVYQEIKGLINEPPPNIACDRQSTIDELKPEVRDLANRFCNQTLQIAEQNNLTVERYNELKSYYDRQDSFYQQVQKILLRLQN